MNYYKFKYRFKQVLIYIIFFAIFFTSFGTNPIGNIAKADPSADFVLRVNMNGKMVPIKSYSVNELEALTQVKQVYSSIDYMPSPNIILAQGVLIKDLLAQANINVSDVQSLKLYSTDGWSHNYSRSYLFGSQRSYYPDIVAKWNKGSANPTASLSDAEKNKSAVEPILALQSYQERFGSEKNWDKLQKNQPISFFFGQTSVNESTYVNFGKFINKMDVILNDDTSLISLDSPKEGQKCESGTPINLSGTAKNVIGVKFHINDPSGKNIFNSQNLTLTNNTFTSSFKLDANAAEGKYNIVFEAENPKNYAAKFNFTVGKENPADNNKNKEPTEDNPPTNRLSTGTGIKGAAADTLTIKVGYYGGPYYVKKVYSLKDLQAFPQVAQTYTFIDNMPAVVLESARGVKLTDLLSNAGIDMNSIEEFHFYCTDVKVGWYQSIPKSYLLDTTRYYYPNLPTHWDDDTGSALSRAADKPVKVNAIIAYEDNWKRFATSPDFTDMQTDTRYRLVFGQTDTSTHNAFKSAKWIHAIEVMLGGKPPAGVTLNQNIANLKVGSTFNLTANVSGGKDSDKRLNWSSSNTDVAKVDENGKVTIVGNGTANITVSTKVGGKTDVCTINTLDKTGSKSLSSAANNKNSNKSTKKNDNKEMSQKSSNAGSSYLTGKDVKSGADEVSESQQEAGDQPWRAYEMSEDASPLQMQKEDESSRICVAVISVLLLLFGSIRRYLKYVKGVTK
ncbi:bacterial Ig-like domain (group 2) [Clostridium ragsdalei P11]|uniref:Bacterial Ig-like domain (Group 2) n=1 Tax=Clostridium ragsdalei P11 TaxID=1353534 RepID=A0A1A6AKZ5_9CLOT|nr:Ig-like domain-containing protein [Clostridium ragsdalei]OBR90755.1 bacterial Ig-like domain (group 2) [Clostridium ragsdalei P11]